MLIWRYAPATDGGWETTVMWHGPHGSKKDLTTIDDSALTHLNNVGADGWELVAVTEEPIRADGRARSRRYHLKRTALENRRRTAT